MVASSLKSAKDLIKECSDDIAKMQDIYGILIEVAKLSCCKG